MEGRVSLNGRTLGGWTEPMVELACTRCARHGRYRRDRLVARFGERADLTTVRQRLVGICNYREGCGAHYVEPPRAARPQRQASGGKPMTVGELIQALRAFSPTLPVVLSGGRFAPAIHVRVIALDTSPPRPAREGDAHLVIMADGPGS